MTYRVNVQYQGGEDRPIRREREGGKFKADDIVRFADGNGKMFLWGDKVEIDWMIVKGYREGSDCPILNADPYEFSGFSDDVLVKVGELYDTSYDDDGNEVYVWLTELNEEED